jgi:16S rRNA (uracil1498-N3)-methyltransferase
VISLFSSVTAGEQELAGAAAQHLRVRRAQPGAAVRLVDGRGAVGWGVVSAISRNGARVTIDRIESVARPKALEVVLPVADRERMLFAAEKCVELQATSLRPGHFSRSASVTQRGEGPRFREKMVARMRTSLEQSGGAWLPHVHEEEAATAIMGMNQPGGMRVLLDRGGDPLSSFAAAVSVLAVGPEGGLEAGEIETARHAGWTIASLGPSTLRFETAIIAGLAIVRASQFALAGKGSSGGEHDG